jgi:hypothetical protein
MNGIHLHINPTSPWAGLFRRSSPWVGGGSGVRTGQGSWLRSGLVLGSIWRRSLGFGLLGVFEGFGDSMQVYQRWFYRIESRSRGSPTRALAVGVPICKVLQDCISLRMHRFAGGPCPATPCFPLCQANVCDMTTVEIICAESLLLETDSVSYYAKLGIPFYMFNTVLVHHFTNQWEAWVAEARALVLLCFLSES